MVNNRPTPNRPNGPQAHLNAASSKAQNPKAATLNAASAITASAMAARASTTNASATSATANASRQAAPYQPAVRAAAPGYAPGPTRSATRDYSVEAAGRNETRRSSGTTAAMHAAPTATATRSAASESTAADEERWHVQVAAGDVRVVTLDKLDDLYRYEVVDDDTFVWQPGMSNWIKLGTLLEAADVAAPEPIYVQLGPNNIKPVTLEQLGDYYRYGTVDASTLVWTAATNQWTTLAMALGQGEQAPDEQPEDPFFVVFGPGDVREITLEQLDDFYRYGVISESTMLWQKGMGEWQPLGKVAGIEDTPAPIRKAPEPRLVPAVAPTTVLIPSSPPVSFDIEPEEPIRSRRSWSLRLAVAAGLLLTLARNDVLLSVLGPAGLEGKYVAMEQSLLGGPAFGTERAVEGLIKSCGGHLEPVRLPIAVEQFTKDASGKDSRRPASEPASVSHTAEGSPSNATAARSPAPVAASTVNSASAASPGTKASASPLAAAIQAAADPHKQPTAALRAPTKAKPAGGSRATAARSSKPHASGKATLKSGGNYYDPLNAAL